MLLSGFWVFERFVISSPSPAILKAWRRIGFAIIGFALPAAIVSGVAWLAFVTIEMTDLPVGEALTKSNLELVLQQTDFGKLWSLRAILLTTEIVALVAMAFAKNHPTLRRLFQAIVAVLAAAFLASLAWAGHGRMGSPPSFHLVADAAHLLVAGVWPTGLLPIGLLLFLRLEDSRDRECLLATVRRFSRVSLISVALLAISGTIDSCYMLDSVRDLTFTAYGRVLLVKLTLFTVMVGGGAINRIWLMPTDELAWNKSRRCAQLRFSVMIELSLGIAVVMIVGLLGLIAPSRQ